MMADGAERIAAPRAAFIEVDFIRIRIERALAQRARYRYVQPKVLREERGFRIESPCCSRNVDASGGVIDIALLTRDKSGRWHLHARDHAARRWRLHRAGADLEALLAVLCQDADRIFWP
jgi:hypothetical protein